MRETATTRLLAAALLAAAAVLTGCGSDTPPGAASPNGSGVADTTREAPDAAEAAAAEAAAVLARDERLRQLSDQSRPPAADWQPELTPTDAAAFDDTLARAEEAFSAGNLVNDPGNALGLYLSVLEAEPAHEAALAGVARIVAELQLRVEQALSERRYEEAARPMPVLLKLRPRAAPRPPHRPAARSA